MSKRVVINAMIAPYDGPHVEGTEYWCVNGAFRHQKHVDRVYAMDDLVQLPTGWADEINLLPDRIRYITIRKFDEIPRSEPYPIRSVLRYFHNNRFFACTMAYMLAHAIYEKFDHIVISGAYWTHDSEEYASHVSCCNFWAGMAIGHGVNLETYGPCMLCRPHAWEPALYGYETNGTRHVIHAGLAAAHKWASLFPYQPQKNVDVDVLPEDHP